MTEIVSNRRNLWFGVALALLVAQIIILYSMGRLPICECGYVKLFEPGVNTSGNSQHLSDWYTPSHIIHGFLFYGLGWLLMRRAPLSARLSLAVLIEAAWEIAENSPLVIDRYRNATMALGYSGDSILNSGMDTVFMALGFLFAARMPVCEVWADMGFSPGKGQPSRMAASGAI